MQINHGLVLEDQHDARQWALQALQEAFPGIEAQGAASLAAAREMLGRQTPDVCLVDLELPDGSGVDFIRDLKATAPACLVIVSTLFADDRHLFPALRAGAKGYVLKDDARQRISTLLRQALAGEPPLSAPIVRRLLQAYETELSATDGLGELSERESEVLILAAKGYTLSQLAAALEISPNTASWHLKNVYRKLGVSSRAEAAIAAAQRGLISTQ